MSSTKKSKSVLKSAHTNVALSGKLHKIKDTKTKETFSRVEQIDESEVEADAGEDSEEDDDGGIDEEGMERLMKALGDDGLDEFEQAQLEAALDGADSESEEEDGEEDRSEEEEDSDEDEEEAEGDSDGDTEGEQEGDGQFIELEDIEAVIDDAVPIQKVEINNEVALARIRESIQLDPSLPWTETLAVSYPHTIDVDVNDDLNREMAFYKQALHSANHARQLVTKSFPTFPWTRPSDYFAEMVKSDVHMERIRQRVLDEKAGIKKSEEKRKEREGKKFGKQVQIEKLKDRERGKKEMEERLKGLKRKRKDVLDNPDGNDDAFDIAVEDALSDRPAKRGRGGPGGGSKLSRQGRDTKYGFGGAGRRSKQNNAESTDDFSGRGGRGGSRAGGAGRGGSKRLGKSKRITARSK
ncbi:eukaryotic rRNA processing protein EBP2-domain-containing protein [Lentinula aff. detonsa]|uniref:Eukaryotic rRNA processing protein EBP2-domain-containing protein n=1 Tax=Lentinula aff. detonsa TaxID=2804958 RepID=A0AA38L5N0_9AGAR|nr:eukaryotic rRNA processing protein EBP2-domain-containing protein [Lentinula aff. detonsa]